MLTYHGVLAAAAARRDEIVPGYGGEDSADSQQCRPRSAKPSADGVINKREHPERMFWSELIRRVFLADVLACPCGGWRAVLAMVFDPMSIERVLTHLGLPYSPPERAPPRAPSRSCPPYWHAPTVQLGTLGLRPARLTQPAKVVRRS